MLRFRKKRNHDNLGGQDHGSKYLSMGYYEIDDIVNEILSRPFTEELVWMTPEEEEKKIRQAAINGVLDDLQEYFENDPPIDNGAHTFRRIMNKIAELRQQTGQTSAEQQRGREE